MHPKGTSYRAPTVKFIARLDLEQDISFMDRHLLTGEKMHGGWEIDQTKRLRSSIGYNRVESPLLNMRQLHAEIV